MGFWTQRLAGLTGADCFVLALDRMMKRHGQHGLIGQTHLLMEGVPDIESLSEGARSLCQAHPILDAYITRNLFTLEPVWRIEKNRKREIALTLWREGRAKLPQGTAASSIESGKQLAEDLLNQPLDNGVGLRNLRLDLVFLESGGSLLLLTWNHLLFDGKGAEFLVGALLDATQGKSLTRSSSALISTARFLSLPERFKKAKPAVDRFSQLVRNGFRSLSGPSPLPLPLRFNLLQFNKEETASIQCHGTSLAGPFFVSFYLACAARAHRQVFLSRGEDPSHYVSSIPVQVRRKGGNKDPFQNSVTVLFFSLRREDLESLERAVEASQKQFEEMTRLELGPSFATLLGLMCRIPSFYYMKFLGTQFSGEITSFFHSTTGNFALDSGNLCGASIVDAYHVPSISAPPGSGLFFGEYRGQLTATYSWRDGAVKEREADLFLNHLRKDLMAS